MAAELIPEPGGCPGHLLRLPPGEAAADLLAEVRYGLAAAPPLQGRVTLESGDWPLHTGDLRQLITLLRERELELVALRGRCPTSLVAAAALGLESDWCPEAVDS